MLSSPFETDGPRRRAALVLALLALAAAATLIAGGCGKEETGPEPPVLLGISVSPDTLEFTALSTSQGLTVTGSTTTGNVNLTTDPGTAYLSRDGAVVSVSATGSVTAAGAGAAYVVATNGGFSDSALAVVNVVTLIAIAVAPDTLVLPAIGARVSMTVTGTTTSGSVDLTSSPQTSYISRSQAIVGVVAGGSVNAVAAGQTYVVASNGGFSDSALAIVDLASGLAVTSLTVLPASVSFIVLSDTRSTSTTVIWENGARLDGSGSPIAYVSDDPAIASVDASGVIGAVAEGSTTVRASLGGAEDTVAVTVAHQYSFAAEILPIFTGPLPPTAPNGCVGSTCHINATLGYGSGLHLDSYPNLMAGATCCVGSCCVRAVVTPFDGANSRIVKALRGQLTSEGIPQMPRLRPPLPDSTITKIEIWIDQGAQEN